MRVRRKAPWQGVAERLGLPADVMGMFKRIAKAEVMIQQACVRWPSRQAQLRACFKLLMPTPVLLGRVDDVYEAHVAELLERVAHGQDTRPGTKAEVLCGLLGAATIAPPGTDQGRFIELVFHQVLPGRLVAEPTPEQWPGQFTELLTDARRTLAQQARR